MKKKNKKKKWMKKRHQIISKIAYCILAPYVWWKYGVKTEPFKEMGDRAYLFLMNHQTPFDQFFIGMSLRGKAVYYLATEDIFSKGFVSDLLRWAVAPIPIKKQTTDVAAVMNCMKVAREGGSIVIAPEGNRTYSGKTENINPAIATMAYKMKLPIALYRIEGGYGVQPRWGDDVRKGKMRAYVSRVIEPEEYANLTIDELYELIKDGLMVNEGVADACFKSEHRAEYLERAVYVCPYCGLSEFESDGNFVECKKCHRKIEYGVDKKLIGVGFDFPFQYMTEWYDYQNEFICNLDVMQLTETPLYHDSSDLYEVILNKNKKLIRENVSIKLFGDRVVIDEGLETELILPFSEVTAAAVCGKNKLNMYHGGKVYQFKGSKRFNALKYVNLYFRHKNISKGDNNGKFLGL